VVDFFHNIYIFSCDCLPWCSDWLHRTFK